MSAANKAPIFSRAPIIAVGGIMALSILIAAAGRITGPAGTPPQSTAVIARDVRFADRPDGGIDVFSGTHPQPVDVILPTADNFLRASMRTLGRERARDGVSPALPFRLTKWADGRLTLDDFSTNRHFELEAFGETNEAVYARVLMAAASVP